MTKHSFGDAANLLAEAFRTGNQLDDLPLALRPETWDDVLLIQDLVLDQLGPIGGWKVATVDPEGRVRVPIPASLVGLSPAELKAASSPAEIEVEIGVRLATDLPDIGRDYSVEAAADAIGSLHLAIEVIGSRFIDRKAVSRMTAIADLGSNGRIIIGPPMVDWRGYEVGTVAMALTADGNEVGRVAGGWSTTQMLEALAGLATHSARRNGGLKAGQVVITGARIGPLPISGPAEVVATASDFGSVELAITS